jgi:hypothetical protein
MSNRKSDDGDRLPGGLDGPGRWRADLKERITYLVLDLGVGVGLAGYQAHTFGANVTLLLASAVALLVVVDLLLKWKRLPHRLLTIAVYACLIAVVVSGFFTGIGVLWAVVNGVVFFFGAGMYESVRVTIEERPGPDKSTKDISGP